MEKRIKETHEIDWGTPPATPEETVARLQTCRLQLARMLQNLSADRASGKDKIPLAFVTNSGLLVSEMQNLLDHLEEQLDQKKKKAGD
jgi:hypothetical protein